ncbi:MAG: hypothetical protein QM484_03890 [Woeseiaceae bacterium]
MGKMIGLDVPKRTKPGKQAFSIRPRKVSAWIEELPRANLGETAKQIFTVLKQTNLLEYSYQDRIRFLESLREPVEYVTSSMKKHFIGVSLPLPSKNHQIASITKQIYLKMAIGYNIALEDTLAKNLIIFDKSSLVMLTHRSIYYTGQSILTSYQSYTPFSISLWTELHRLYGFAEKRKLLKSKIKDELRSNADKTSISSEYARILLLSLASPYHLRHGETGKVYYALGRWLKQPIVRAFNNNDKDSDKLVDNLSATHAPCALSLAVTNGITDTSSLRLIETESLSKKLEFEILNNEDVGSSTITNIDLTRPDLSHDLLKRLLIAWNMASKRHFPRKEKHEAIKVNIGLSAAHQFITHKARAIDDAKYSTKFKQRAHFESTEIHLNKQDPTATSNDVWGLIYPDESSGLEPLIEQELSLQEHIQITDTVQAEERKYQSDNWLIVNESAKGMMINHSEDLKNKAQVGELVSIQRTLSSKNEHWSIGVIRWIKTNSDMSLQMGLEILNPNATAVGIRPASLPDAPLQRTIMLPELKNLKEPACLITGSVRWREGNKIIINMVGKDIFATLTREVQNTGLFSQFEFEINAQNETQSNTDSQSAPDDKDYSDIWASI